MLDTLSSGRVFHSICFRRVGKTESGMCAKRFPSTSRHLNPSKKRRGVGCEKGNFLLESDATPKIHFLVGKPHVSSDVEAFEGARDVLRTPQDDLRSSDVLGSQSPRAQSPVQFSMFRGGRINRFSVTTPYNRKCLRFQWYNALVSRRETRSFQAVSNLPERSGL